MPTRSYERGYFAALVIGVILLQRSVRRRREQLDAQRDLC